MMNHSPVILWFRLVNTVKQSAWLIYEPTMFKKCNHWVTMVNNAQWYQVCGAVSTDGWVLSSVSLKQFMPPTDEWLMSRKLISPPAGSWSPSCIVLHYDTFCQYLKVNPERVKNSGVTGDVWKFLLTKKKAETPHGEEWEDLGLFLDSESKVRNLQENSFNFTRINVGINETGRLLDSNHNNCPSGPVKDLILTMMWRWWAKKWEFSCL